jgi:hypothetical protein
MLVLQSWQIDEGPVTQYSDIHLEHGVKYHVGVAMLAD